MDYPEEIWIRLGKYLSDECDQNDIAILNEWIKNQENINCLSDLTKIYEASLLNELDPQDSFKKLTRRLKNDQLL